MKKAGPMVENGTSQRYITTVQLHSTHALYVTSRQNIYMLVSNLSVLSNILTILSWAAP